MSSANLALNACWFAAREDLVDKNLRVRFTMSSGTFRKGHRACLAGCQGQAL